MNTPKTKKPKRYSGAEPEDDGEEYTRGINNDKMCQYVGYVITFWPQLEERMVAFFADLAGVESEQDARIIFRSIINQKTRISIMRALLEKSPNHKARSEWFDSLIDEYASLNRIRNIYAHGLWYTRVSDSSVFIEEDAETHLPFLQKREVRADDIISILLRFNKFSGELQERAKLLALIRVMRETSPQIPSPPSSEGSGLIGPTKDSSPAPVPPPRSSEG